jgi:hypothetical protein
LSRCTDAGKNRKPSEEEVMMRRVEVIHRGWAVAVCAAAVAVVMAGVAVAQTEATTDRVPGGE